MKLPQRPPDFSKLVHNVTMELMLRLGTEAFQLGPLVDGRYLHWDELRRRPVPQGLTHEDWWLRLKLARQSNTTRLPLLDTSGRQFLFATFGAISQRLHIIDSKSAGRVEALPHGITRETGRRYVLSSLIEEAISSSILEGAATTRQDAKKLIAQGRTPRTVAEKMVVNNYLTMQRISDLKNRPLTLDMLLEIHQAITQGTLADSDQEGRIARPGEERDVSDFENNLIHKPPLPENLPARLEAMIKFANAGEADSSAMLANLSAAPNDGQGFLHPVVRSILLHFWLAYDHPFMDGNGRTARALFYWSMLRHGYWFFEFVSISELLLRSPGAYYRAFQYSKADDGDCSYFVVHQLNVLCDALAAAEEHIVERQAQLRELSKAVRSLGLNKRQQETLRWFLAHPGAELSFKEHQHKHGITYQTARTDLMSLADQELLRSTKSGRMMIYYASADLEKRLFEAGPG